MLRSRVQGFPIVMGGKGVTRVFKTAWFSRAAAGIADQLLCEAVKDSLAGRLLVNLGGGVYKKRLFRNQYRSILPCRCGACRVYEYQFAKNGRDNISDAELNGYKTLAKAYAGLSDAQRNDLLGARDLLEICHAH